jgi:hypothetical protein
VSRKGVEKGSKGVVTMRAKSSGVPKPGESDFTLYFRFR